MKTSIKIASLLEKKPYLLWWVSNKKRVSLELATQAILGNGNFEDAKKLFKEEGITKIKNIFQKQLKKRNAYHQRTIRFFKLYFKNHA